MTSYTCDLPLYGIGHLSLSRGVNVVAKRGNVPYMRRPHARNVLPLRPSLLSSKRECVSMLWILLELLVVLVALLRDGLLPTTGAREQLHPFRPWRGPELSVPMKGRSLLLLHSCGVFCLGRGWPLAVVFKAFIVNVVNNGSVSFF